MAYPDEQGQITAKAEYHIREFLRLMGQDTNREGLEETPKRYVKFFKQFVEQPEWEFKTFKNETDEMVIVKDVPFYSLCEHHLAPFFGTGTIAYIPGDSMAGLSKLPRTLDLFANKPQNQERITKQVAEYIQDKLNPKGVAVVLQARHMCVEMRGVKKAGAMTITSALKGMFKDDQKCRAEFFNLIK